MIESVGSGNAERRERPVPGTVRLMTEQPIEIRGVDAHGRTSLAERVEERPWLVAAGMLGLFVVLVLARYGRR